MLSYIGRQYSHIDKKFEILFGLNIERNDEFTKSEVFLKTWIKILKISSDDFVYTHFNTIIKNKQQIFKNCHCVR